MDSRDLRLCWLVSYRALDLNFGGCPVCPCHQTNCPTSHRLKQPAVVISVCARWSGDDAATGDEVSGKAGCRPARSCATAILQTSQRSSNHPKEGISRNKGDSAACIEPYPSPRRACSQPSVAFCKAIAPRSLLERHHRR